MRFPRRDRRVVALAAGGAAVAASLFFTAPLIKGPVFSEPESGALVTMLPDAERAPVVFPPMLAPAFSGAGVKPDLSVAPAMGMSADALVPKDFPVGMDYVPQAMESARRGGIEGAWAVGPRWAGDEYDWLVPTGLTGGYALVYDVAPPGPADLQRYGGDPNAPDTGARTYTGSGNGTNVVVPEPGVLALLSAGVILFGGRRRRWSVEVSE